MHEQEVVPDARFHEPCALAVSEFVLRMHYADGVRQPSLWRVRCSALTLYKWTTTDVEQVTCDACLALMAQDVINNLSSRRVYETNDG